MTCSRAAWRSGKFHRTLEIQSLSLYVKAKGQNLTFEITGITLLSIGGNIVSRVLLNRLIPTLAEENISQSQCGFKASRSTSGMNFVLQQIQEECRKQNIDLYTAFILFTKAFDTVKVCGRY